MRDRAALDAWEPALPAYALPHTPPVCVRILEICSSCSSVSRATALEVRRLFGPETQIDVFTVDGKPRTGATREVDILAYDWAHDEELARFRAEGEGVVFYAHASPPCGPYSSMIHSALKDCDLR
jgi:hypothetical protein